MKSISHYQAVIFDFDGVLAESMDVKTEAFRQLFQPYGQDIVDKIVHHHVTNGGISRYTKIQYYYEHYLNKAITEQELNAIAQDFSSLVVDKVIASPWVPGVKEYLENNYSTQDFYVVSGTPQGELDLVIQKRHMKKYFKEVHGTPATKPKLITQILTTHQYQPETALYIGDSYSDYQAAHQTHIPFLGRVVDTTHAMFPPEVPTISDFFDVLK